MYRLPGLWKTSFREGVMSIGKYADYALELLAAAWCTLFLHISTWSIEALSLVAIME
jgi:hypothetical protein